MKVEDECKKERLKKSESFKVPIADTITALYLEKQAH